MYQSSLILLKDAKDLHSSSYQFEQFLNDNMRVIPAALPYTVPLPYSALVFADCLIQTSH